MPAKLNDVNKRRLLGTASSIVMARVGLREMTGAGRKRSVCFPVSEADAAVCAGSDLLSDLRFWPAEVRRKADLTCAQSIRPLRPSRPSTCYPLLLQSRPRAETRIPAVALRRFIAAARLDRTARAVRPWPIFRLAFRHPHMRCNIVTSRDIMLDFTPRFILDHDRNGEGPKGSAETFSPTPDAELLTPIPMP